MDAIDALIAARVLKPAGLVSGEASVWNGTGWDRSSVTRIGATSLGSGTPDATKFLRGDGSWQVPSGGITYTRALTPPGSPADGDIWYYVDSLTATTVEWEFRWNAGSSNADKWEFLGGAGVIKDIGGTPGTQTPGTAFVDLTIPLAFTVPRAGVYRAQFASTAAPPAGQIYNIALKKGATATADADGTNPTLVANLFAATRQIEVAGLSAADVLKLQVRTTAAGQLLTYYTVNMRIEPVRVS
jgi:hypothetical protein